MKKIALIAAGVFFLACLTANAQTGQQQDMQSGQQQSMKKQGMMQGDMMKGGMMQGGMMQGGMGPMHGGMMGSAPMQSSMTMVNLLPEMEEQLSLTEDQADQLIDMRSDFKKQQVDYQAEMTKQKRKLQRLIDRGAPAQEVRNQMEACSDVRIDMHSAAYETEQEMKAVLTDEQKDQLEVIMEEHDDMMQKAKPKRRGGRKN